MLWETIYFARCSLFCGAHCYKQRSIYLCHKMSEMQHIALKKRLSHEEFRILIDIYYFINHTKYGLKSRIWEKEPIQWKITGCARKD